jgi:hypothetical protein
MFNSWPPDLLNPPPRVQIYSLCSWFSLMYLDHASIIDLFRDWCVPRWRFPSLPFPLDCSHLRPAVLVSTTLATRPFSCTRYAHTRHARHATPRVSNVYLMHSSSCSSWRSSTNTKTSTRTKKTGCAPAPSLSPNSFRARRLTLSLPTAMIRSGRAASR